MTHTLNPNRSSTLLQFSLRAVLCAVAAAAVVCAIAAPYLRSMPAEQLTRVLVLGVGTVAGSLSIVAMMCLLRLRVERRSGSPLLLVPLGSARAGRVVFVSGLAQMIVFGWMSRSSINPDTPWLMLGLSILTNVAASLQLINAFMILWWRDAMFAVAFCRERCDLPGVAVSFVGIVGWLPLELRTWMDMAPHELLREWFQAAAGSTR